MSIQTGDALTDAMQESADVLEILAGELRAASGDEGTTWTRALHSTLNESGRPWYERQRIRWAQRRIMRAALTAARHLDRMRQSVRMLQNI